jgi:hypothetical protein
MNMVFTKYKRRNQKEHEEQVKLFRWIDSFRNLYLIDPLKYYSLKHFDFFFAVPNGGKRNIKTAVKLKAEGVRAGVLDFICLWPINYKGESYVGLAIEMKHGKNKQTLKQKEWFEKFVTCGWKCVVCYSWVEAKEEIIKYYGGV